MSPRPLTSAEAVKLDEIVRPLVQSPQLGARVPRQRNGFQEILRIAKTVTLPPPAGARDVPQGTYEEVLHQLNGIEGDNSRYARFIDPPVLNVMSTVTQKIRALLTEVEEPASVAVDPILPLPTESSLDTHVPPVEIHPIETNGQAHGPDILPAPIDHQGREERSRMNGKHAVPRKRLVPAEKSVKLKKKTAREGNVISEELLNLAREYGLEISGDDAMEHAWERLMTFAKTPMTMLIRGQSGTGKEPFAQAVHAHRKKNGLVPSTKDLVELNCAAINAGIAESELFGHKKGAFTGAIEDRKGKFEDANGGTLFLDEVGDMPLEQQAKLLRVLENGMVTPAGSNKATHVNVKVICATNRPLEKLVEAGKFRNDLLQRLKACQVQLPSWADRDDTHKKAVIDFLVPGLKKKYQGEHFIDIDGAGYLYLLEGHFGGNVREVKNLMERAYIMASGKAKAGSTVMLGRADFEGAMDPEPAEEPTGAMRRHGAFEHGNLTPETGGYSLPLVLHLPSTPDIADIQSQITALLAHLMYHGQAHGSVNNAAKLLGVSRRTLTSWRTEYDKRQQAERKEPQE
jgi:transcriptional regulator with GAF, ATPase, and Fis domain